MPRTPFLRAALAGALLLAPPAHAASPNLLLNPGFEERLPGHPWMPAGWDTSASGLPTTFFGCDTFVVHSGRFAANVANISTFLTVGHNWSQSVLVGREAWGKDAVFTVWTRSNGIEGRAYCLVQAYRDTISKMAKTWNVPRDEAASRLNINRVDDPLAEFGWKREVFMEPETPWVHREMRIYVPPGINILFVRCGLLGTGQLLIDDASLTLETALPAPALRTDQNLLLDPGFEGDGSAWEYAIPPFAGISVVRDTTGGHTGRACMRFESIINPAYPPAPVTARTGVCQAITNRNLAGKRVKLTAWVKTDSLKGVAYVKIYSHGQYGMVQGIASERYSLNTPWTETTQTLDLPPDTYEVWVWCLYDAPVPGLVYFDDARFEVLGPAPKAPPPPKPFKVKKPDVKK
jgi:hypothetical protein